MFPNATAKLKGERQTFVGEAMLGMKDVSGGGCNGGLVPGCRVHGSGTVTASAASMAAVEVAVCMANSGDQLSHPAVAIVLSKCCPALCCMHAVGHDPFASLATQVLALSLRRPVDRGYVVDWSLQREILAR